VEKKFKALLQLFDNNIDKKIAKIDKN